MRRIFLLSLILSGCAPVTGDQLVDAIVSEQYPLSECVAIYGKTQITKPEKNEPPTELHAKLFADPEARKSAELVEIDLNLYDDSLPSLRNFGSFSGDSCPMQVSSPLISRNHAFLRYSDPSGEIGAYAFYRDGSKWVFVEKVHLGYW